MLCVGKSIKTHLYWAMKNYQGSAEDLRSLIDSIPAHYKVKMLTPLVFIILLLAVQGDHTFCHSLPHAPLHTQQGPAFRPSYHTKADRDPALNLHLSKCARILQREPCVHIGSPYYLLHVYSVSRHHCGRVVNHMLLTYLSKRIHFSTRTFNMRMNLAYMSVAFPGLTRGGCRPAASNICACT